MEGAEHEVEPRERCGLHVAGAFRREVHLDALEDPRTRPARVDRVDAVALCRETGFIHPVRDA